MEKNFIQTISDSYEKNKILFYDNTLRDGEQFPGVYFTNSQKVKIAKILYDLGVDFFNVGFPAVSKLERNAIQAILEVIPNQKTVALARCIPEDIKMIKDLGVPTVSLFFPGSEILRKSKGKFQDDDEIDRIILECLKYAKSLGLNTIFAFEDTTRCDPLWLIERYKKYSIYTDAFGLTDTVGAASPWEIEKLTLLLNTLNKPLITHFHNDLGLANANSLVAAKSGCTILGCTVSGIGERAGNASLEEVSTAVKYLLDEESNIKQELLYKATKQVQDITNIRLDSLRPLVGDNAFKHESAIHVDSLLIDENSYQFVLPETMGRKMEFCLGKHSGVRGIIGFHKFYNLNLSDESYLSTQKIITSCIESGKKNITEEVLKQYELLTQ